MKQMRLPMVAPVRPRMVSTKEKEERHRDNVEIIVAHFSSRSVEIITKINKQIK